MQSCSVPVQCFSCFLQILHYGGGRAGTAADFASCPVLCPAVLQGGGHDCRICTAVPYKVTTVFLQGQPQGEGGGVAAFRLRSTGILAIIFRCANHAIWRIFKRYDLSRVRYTRNEFYIVFYNYLKKQISFPHSKF